MTTPPAGATTESVGWIDQLADLLGISSDKLTEYGVSTIGVLVFLFVGWLVANWIGRITLRAMTRAKIELTLSRFIAKAVRWGILLLVLLGCLSKFGIEMTSFAALIAAMGLAIGLAFQGSLSNFSAGMMLLIFRPYKVGDVVDVGGVKGKVFELDMFTTMLDTPDNRRIIVPNSSIFGSTIENITFHDTRRVDVSVGVEYGADIDATRAALTSAIAKVETVLDDPPPQVVLQELGASSVDWQVRAWCPAPDYWAQREALIRAVKMTLDEANIGIPFPQMDVHLDQLQAAT